MEESTSLPACLTGIGLQYNPHTVTNCLLDEPGVVNYLGGEMCSFSVLCNPKLTPEGADIFKIDQPASATV